MPARAKTNLLNLVSVTAALMIVAICASLFARIIATHDNSTATTQQTQNRQAMDKYGYGTCNTDSDCVPTGCSAELCSSDETLMTTCEVKPDAPDTNTYSCGCVEGMCSWYLK